MARGDLYEATAAGTEDLYYVDTGMYDTPEYGAVYVLDAERPALVETGIGTHHDVVLDALDAVGVAPADVEVIAPTHVHLDHAGGAGFLAEACPNADVCVYEPGARHLVDPGRLWEGTKRAMDDQIEFYTEPEPVDADRVVELEDGDVVDLGDHALEVHAAPGHAPHQAVFYDPANDGAFAADAAGIYVPAHDEVHPTTPPPDFDLETALEDVERLRDLDPAALYYTHFGDAPVDGRLTAYAETLEAWVDAVREKRAELDDDEAVIEHFAADPPTVDVWGERKARNETRVNVRGVLAYLDGR